MKKSLSILFLSMICASSYAQWSVPVPSKTQEMATDGTPQFLYNKDAGGFYTCGNEYGTRASIGIQADSVKFVLIGNGNYNFCDYPSAKTVWYYLSCNSFDAMWTDAPNSTGSETYPNTDTWAVIPQGDGSYKFANNGYDPSYTLGVAEIYQGKKGDTRLYINDFEQTYYDGEETVLSFTGKFYDTWYFIDAEEYESLKPQVEKYLCAKNLISAIENAKTDGIQHDFSKLEAIYNNSSSSLEELSEALATTEAIIAFANTYKEAMSTYPTVDLSALKAICDNINSTSEEINAATAQIYEEAYKQLGATASIDNPVDFSSAIGNGTSTSRWTRTWKGVSTNGTWATNTSATEAIDGADGTDMTPSFCEMKIGSGSTISDCFITQTLSSMPAGLYKFTADVRLYREADKITAFKGAKMFCANDTIVLQDMSGVTYNGTKSILWNKDYFSVIAIVKESGDIVLGFDIHACNYNWFAFKNTTLSYYGTNNMEENALKLFKQSVKLEELEDVDANPTLLASYNEAVNEYLSTTTLPDAKKAVANVSASMIDILNNKIAYENLLSKIEVWSNAIAEKVDLTGEEWDAFSDFMQTVDEVEGYPTPNPVAILEGDRTLSTADITAYIKKVEELYTSAVTHSLQEGSDCTDMLKNASFKNGFTDWVKNAGTAGGLTDFPCVERYGGPVEIYQIVKDVPNGLFSLSCKAFERPDENGNYDINTPTTTYIFMNDIQTPVQNILADAIPVNKAVNYVNSFFEGSISEGYTDTSGTTNNDVMVNVDGEDAYIPNGMSGASYAFRSGRYEQKVYGFVSNGEMKIGLTSNGVSAHWVLWSDFKLTYEGRNATALKEALSAMSSQLESFASGSTEMTDPAVSDAKDAAESAMSMIGSSADMMYNALVDLNTATQAAHENAEAVRKHNSLMDKMTTAYDSADEEGKAAFEAIFEKVINYNTLTTPQLNELYKEMLSVFALLTPAESTETLATPSADKEVVTGTCYIAGEAGEITNSTKNGYLKMRTGNNGNTLTFRVKEDYKITGITVEGYSNNTSDTADRSIDLIGMYIDGSEESLIDEPHTFNGGTMTQTATTFSKSGFTAYQSVVLKFDNSKITSDDSKGKNKQIMAKVTFTYTINSDDMTAIERTETVTVPLNNAIYNLNGQRIAVPQPKTIYIKGGQKYIAK